MNEKDKIIKSATDNKSAKSQPYVMDIVEEYKMSMGGSFFNNFTKKHEEDLELEELIIKKGINNHLFDTHELLSIYDNLSEYNRREFFQRVVVAFIKLKFKEDNLE
ncbi:hypothetical protein [Methanobacterium sp.]|uniref:hypothetical protein n=1 Tax=Methanobacterium sp. TaxID=2164 RepID=UPI003C70E16E